MKRLLTVLFVISCVAIPIASAGAECPIPQDLNVVAAAQDLPANIKELQKNWWSGIWNLSGGRTMDSMLIFEKISATEATVIHSYSGLGTQPPGYSRNTVPIKISEDKIELKVLLGSGPMELDCMPGKKIIKAFIVSGGRPANTTFKAIEPKL